MASKEKVKWLPEPADDNYVAAENYLQSLYKSKKARRWARKVRRENMTGFIARDILRASGISILSVQAFDWPKQHEKINAGKRLSPTLLVRQDNGRNLIVAGGFQRLCALFANDQDIKVPCKII